MNILEKVNFLQEKRMISEIFRMLLLLGGFPCEYLKKNLMARDTCLDPGVGLIFDHSPFAFSRLRGKSEVERSLTQEVEASLVI